MTGGRKRGASLAINLIITVAIGLLAMVIIVFLFRRVPIMVQDSTDCLKNGGRCIESGGTCSLDMPRAYELQCSSKTQICCKGADSAQGSLEVSRFTTAERAALQDPIFMTIDKDPKSVTEFNLKEGTSYDITLKFNDKLPEKAFGPVILYATEKSNTGKMYLMGPEGMYPEPTAYICKDASKTTRTACSLSEPSKWPFKPSLQDSFKSYTYHIVVLDIEKIECQPFKSVQKTYNTCLTDRKKLSAQDSKELKDYTTFTDEQLLALRSDRDYILAERTYPIKVTRILDISGVNTQWAADNTVTLTVSDQTYDKVGVALINAADLNGIDQIISRCTALKSDSDFTYDVTNIVGTTLETKGIDLGLNLGGFRIPTSSTKLKYVVQTNKIKLINKKATVKIDKATMLKDFYEKTKDEQMLTGENAWLCARATQTGTNNAAYAVSLSPIKVDVIPPEVTQDSISIVYPDPITTTPSYSTQYPSISGTNYFYKQYPQVVISCQDYGQSGCANYDYYLKTGNFINVNVQGDSIGDAITGVALQIGLNQLFDFFAKKDPYNTICPPIYSSSEFRLNTRPTIKLRTEGQGIICIRVRDRVGNQVMVWKQLLTPQEMMKRIAVEEANKELNEALAAAMT